MIIDYSKWIVRVFIIVFLALMLYRWTVVDFCFPAIQFITLLGIILAFLKDILLDLILPPIFQIKTSNSKPHFHEFPTDDKSISQSWLAVELKNCGWSSARNVRLYFNGIESNIIKDFDVYQNLPIRQAFGEALKEKDPLPKPVSVPRKTRFFFSFCYIQNNEPSNIRFNFPRIPQALDKINCSNNAFFEFEILVTADNRFIINNKAKFRVAYSGNYSEGVKVETCHRFCRKLLSKLRKKQT